MNTFLRQPAWCLLLFFGFAARLAAADIDVSGNWLHTVDYSHLQAGAGSDLVAPIQSVAGVATLAISNTGGGNWSVSVARSDIDWPPGVSVAVRRSGGQGAVEGGAAYLTLTGAAQDFISGAGDSIVEIQLRVQGLTVTTPPAAYGLLISYSIQAL